LPEEIFHEYYIIKVAQFHDKVQSKIDEWIYFLKSGKIKKDFSASGIQIASNKLNILNLSEEKRCKYRRYQEEMRDNASFDATLEVEREIAREQSHAQGREQERVSIARSLKNAGIANEVIVENTGLSFEEVEKLRNCSGKIEFPVNNSLSLLLGTGPNAGYTGSVH